MISGNEKFACPVNSVDRAELFSCIGLEIPTYYA
jgi:hypothetical protein